MNTPRGTIQFQLFGIPVYITPMSWVFLALLGGGLNMNSAADLMGILIFVAVAMAVILTHEFGHALVGRYYGGVPYNIVVEGLGAVTNSRPPAGKWEYFRMVLAGPLATLLPGLVAGLVFGLQCMGNPISGLFVSLTAPLAGVVLPVEWVYSLLEGVDAPPSQFMLQLYFTTFSVSVWWCVFNLLPIFPMDGGKLMAVLYPDQRTVCLTGIVCSALLFVWALCTRSVFGMLLFGYFAWINWKILRSGTRVI